MNNDTKAVDRLAHSYMLVRSMHSAVLAAAAERFDRLIALSAFTTSEASSCSCGDSVVAGMAALQAAASIKPSLRDAERDGPLLQKAGRGLECAAAAVHLLLETRSGIAAEVMTFTGAYANDVGEALTHYSRREDAHDDPIGFTASLRGEAAGGVA